jgi:hypothetical protein
VTATLRAHFDGRVLVPEEPVDLPVGCTLEIRVNVVASVSEPVTRPLAKLAALVEQFPANPAAPLDGAVQHDHYLYGAAKRA